MKSSYSFLTVEYRNHVMPTLKVPLSRKSNDDDEPFTTADEVPVPFENGEAISVYAEVFDADDGPDVSISVYEGGEATCSLRCTSGVILSYVTRSGKECLFRLGPAPA
jgi:hypothetical protein